jgi:hypothetical protein
MNENFSAAKIVLEEKLSQLQSELHLKSAQYDELLKESSNRFVFLFFPCNFSNLLSLQFSK